MPNSVAWKLAQSREEILAASEEIAEKIANAQVSLLFSNVVHSTTATYEAYSVVTDGGSSYIALQKVPQGVLLSNSSYWSLFVSKGIDGIDGIDGVDGVDGNDGNDGIVITNITVSSSGNLLVTIA